MTSLITEEIAELIMRAKSKMPTGWRIHTYETKYWIILRIPFKEFNKYSLNDRIRIAEATNQLCMDIKTTGISCFIEKV